MLTKSTLTKVTALLVGYLVLAAAALAQAESPSLRKEVEAVYARWDALTAKKDVKALFDMIDPSFVAIDLDGKTVRYAEVRQHFEQMMGQFDEIKSKIKVDHVYGDQDEVVAWVTMTIAWKQKVGGKVEEMKFTAKFAETLKRTKSGWKFTCSQMLPD